MTALPTRVLASFYDETSDLAEVPGHVMTTYLHTSHANESCCRALGIMER